MSYTTIPSPDAVLHLVRERLSQGEIVSVNMMPRADYDGATGSVAYDLCVHWRESANGALKEGQRDVFVHGHVERTRRKRGGKPPYGVSLFNGAYQLTPLHAYDVSDMWASNLRFNARVFGEARLSDPRKETPSTGARA